MKLLLLAIGISNLDNSSEFELVIVELFIFLLSPANTNYLSLQISVWKKWSKAEKFGTFAGANFFSFLLSHCFILPPDCKELLMRQHPLAPFAPSAPHQPEILVFIAACWPVWYRHQQFCFWCADLCTDCYQPYSVASSCDLESLAMFWSWLRPNELRDLSDPEPIQLKKGDRCSLKIVVNIAISFKYWLLSLSFGVAKTRMNDCTMILKVYGKGKMSNRSPQVEVIVTTVVCRQPPGWFGLNTF